MTTGAQRAAADEDLAAAIRARMAVDDVTDGVVTEWVVLVAQHLPMDDGGSATAVSSWVPDGQPLHRSLGLIDYNATRLRAHIAGNADTEQEH